MVDCMTADSCLTPTRTAPTRRVGPADVERALGPGPAVARIKVEAWLREKANLRPVTTSRDPDSVYWELHQDPLRSPILVTVTHSQEWSPESIVSTIDAAAWALGRGRWSILGEMSEF